MHPVTPHVPYSPIEKATLWFRDEGGANSSKAIAKRILAVVAAIFLCLSIVGIPLVIKAAVIWKRLPAPMGGLIDLDRIPEDKAKRKEMLMGISFSDILKVHDRKLPEKAPPLIKPDRFCAGDPGWKTMKGINLIADHLREKNLLEHLYVCSTMDDFLKCLQKINESNDDFRHAYIVPSYQSLVTCSHKRDCRDSAHEKPDYHAQHKVAVMIERIHGKTKVFVSDSMPYRLDMNRTHLNHRSSFEPEELVHAYLREANLSNAAYYYSLVKRHHAHMGGCETFALRDAVIFLKDNEYFQRLKKFGRFCPLEENGTFESPYYITNLPPENMQYCQSLKQLDEYMARNRLDGYDLNQPMGKDQLSFEDKLNRGVRPDYNRRNKQIVRQNKMIEDRVKKYQLMLLVSIRK